MKLLTNHIGYGCSDYKKAVFQGAEGVKAGEFHVICESSQKTAYSGKAIECGSVAHWQTGYYWTLDFSEVTAEGKYHIELDTSSGKVCSYPFEIRRSLISIRMLSAVGYYFKAQRSSGEWLHTDRQLPFDGPREGAADLHGGWYDATGDYGIHMSHLSHSTYYNPQQAAFSACAFFRVYDLIEESKNEEYSMVKRRILDEGMYGADFIMRMRAPSGSFFRSIGRTNALDCVDESRSIAFEYHQSSSQFGEAITAKEETVTDSYYEVSFRSGGGYCIAALAIAARHSYPGTDFTKEEYLQAAKQAYRYLEINNELYTNDNHWNLIDEYCALDAAVELYKTTGEYNYLLRSRAMAKKVMEHITDNHDGTASLSVVDGRPYYHAAYEGLPVITLLNYAGIEHDCELSETAIAACEKLMRFALTVTKECCNPFGYAKYLYSKNGGQTKTKFFFPLDTEAKPWWQGDNARIASLSCAAKYLSYVTKDKALCENLDRYAEDQLNWIMGLNPFDACMIEGYGRNNIQYYFSCRNDFINCPGGICNGITSGTDDEEAIEFVTEPTEKVADNWRWAEQWIPHASWYLYAMAMKKR